MSYVVQSGVVWVAAYLPWFRLWVCCWVFCSVVDCGVEPGWCVVTRPSVGRKWWCASGCAADWPEVRGEIKEVATGAVAGLNAAGRMLGWAVVCPVHETSWPGGWALCLPSWCILSWCTVVSYSFPNEYLLVRMASFYHCRLLSSLVCHWLVDRVGRSGLSNVVPLAWALKWAVRLAEVGRDGGSERVLCCDG